MAGSDLSTSLNKSGLTGASPRCHRKHQRHASLARVKIGENQFSAFIAAQVTRLSSSTAVVFAKITKYGADRVKAAANLAAIP